MLWVLFRHILTSLITVIGIPNQKAINDKIKSRLESESVCCLSVQNLLSSSLLSKNIKIKTYRNIIFPVLYGCETWSLTLRKERWVKVCENRVLRRVFEPKRDEVTGEWRKLDEEELYHSDDQNKKNDICGACSTYGGHKKCVQGFGEETCGKETTWKT